CALFFTNNRFRRWDELAQAFSFCNTSSNSKNFAPVAGHSQDPASTPQTRGTPDSPTQPIRRAGVPATTAYEGTSLTTTAPAATVAHAPIVTDASLGARAPIDSPRSIVTPTGSHSSPLF